MPTIALIGAGSMVFARKLVGDILSFPELEDSTIRLMDIDEGRLATTTEAAEAMVENGGLPARIESTTDRGQALEGADYVLNVGGTEPFENEIHIPKKYGVKQAIGDTLGPGGVFRALRTTETMLGLTRDMEELCPDALLMNYTNPMAILCWALDEASEIETVGLCHSVPHTAKAISEYVGGPQEELEYWAAGVNHMAWFLEWTHAGEDVYPQLEAAIGEEEIYRQDTVRFEMMRRFGAFITESSHHLSEYVPYFRTDEETIEAMAGEGYAERMEMATYLESWKAESKKRDRPEHDVDLSELEIERSEEYASRLIHSLETGKTRRFNLNVSNGAGAITNLPREACVEVPCLVDGTGIRPCSVGELPPQLAALNRTQIAIQERTVTGALENDREEIHQAIKLDPLTSTVLTLDEAHEMTEELIEANEEYLPELIA